MSQKASAAKRAQQNEVPPHQLGQEVFKSILPDGIDWRPFPAFPPSVRLAVVVGHAVFNYDAASKKFTPDPTAHADCGNSCHVAVKVKDYIFHPYEKR